MRAGLFHEHTSCARSSTSEVSTTRRTQLVGWAVLLPQGGEVCLRATGASIRLRMRYLHTMLRVSNLEESLRFYCGLLGFEEVRRVERPEGRYTLVFLAAPEDMPRAQSESTPCIELTYNWDPEEYAQGCRNFGHLAFEVDDIYALCEKLRNAGVVINRPPRDGRMAFVKSPDGISVELLQKGTSLPPREPWVSLPNEGVW